jgi:hypothetical protein
MVQAEKAPSFETSATPDSPVKGGLVESTADIARSWEVAGDWLADLVKIEAGEATELGRRLAPALFAAGICLAWGNYYHSSRTNPREQDEEITSSELCPG